MSDLREKTCPSCATTFECGGNCWCNDLPKIVPMNSEVGCWCRSCLTKQVKKTIAEHMQNLSPEKIKSIRDLGKPEKFIEGIDYNINETGSWVFSGWYLLRQGGCCDNECTNCPYPKN
jgi:hypothetical protein